IPLAPFPGRKGGTGPDSSLAGRMGMNQNFLKIFAGHNTRMTGKKEHTRVLLFRASPRGWIDFLAGAAHIGR
ncbi:MAG: hypothetical protein WCE23_10705, partial [Candidatus Binatus sp.]|uniref:hypothetical protein n=1 Tax=Candidatus Binatus sp. TaxID=2811406 RepID=UPI003C78F979